MRISFNSRARSNEDESCMEVDKRRSTNVCENLRKTSFEKKTWVFSALARKLNIDFDQGLVWYVFGL